MVFCNVTRFIVTPAPPLFCFHCWYLGFRLSGLSIIYFVGVYGKGFPVDSSPCIYLMFLYQDNVGVWSTVVLNAPGPPRGVVVPVVHPVHSDIFWSRLFEILPKMWTSVDQGGPGGPGEHNPPWWTRTGFYILLMLFPPFSRSLISYFAWLVCGWSRTRETWVDGFFAGAGWFTLVFLYIASAARSLCT